MSNTCRIHVLPSSTVPVLLPRIGMLCGSIVIPEALRGPEETLCRGIREMGRLLERAESYFRVVVLDDLLSSRCSAW